MRNLSLGLVLLTCVGVTAANAGPIMYVDDDRGRLATVDVATGIVTAIGTMPVVMTDIAFDPLGNLFGTTFTGLYSINASTAAASFIGNHGINGANALVFGANGTLYAAGNSTTSLFSLNTGTGAATNLGNMGFASAGDLAFNGGNFYLAATTNQLVSVNLATPASSSAVGAFGVGGVFGLATGNDGVLYAVAGTNVYTVNTATGAATNPVAFVGNGLGTAFGQSFFEEAGATAAVPEPGTMVLLGGGLAAALWTRRRRS